nr:alkaline phosphatase-like [Lytechinus pictus]
MEIMFKLFLLALLFVGTTDCIVSACNMMHLKGIYLTPNKLRPAGSSWLVGLLYRPPNSSSSYWNILRAEIEAVGVDNYDGCLLLGDFNVNMSAGNFSSNRNQLSELMEEFNFDQMVKQSTRIMVNGDVISGSIIDLVYTNRPYSLIHVDTASCGKVPLSWKRAHITPVFKGGDKSLVTNYRPVALTSVLCKLLEGFIVKNIQEHIYANGLLNLGQHGFVSGKATGLITTTRITHATPAAAYAHSPERDWEYDGQVPDEEADDGCIDIARQLVEENNFINVILGGGRANLLPNTTLDPEYTAENTTGSRRDGRNLIDQWLSDKASFSSHYVWNKTAFEQIDPTSTEFVMGLFEPSHMRYEVERLNDTAGEPSIVEMTEFAINLLSNRDEDGYFLMVEGGRIDHAHHDSVAYKALTDTIAFHEAAERAVEMTDSADTLIVVTADHGHAFTMGGYASRGNPIFGYDDWGNGTDGKPYLTLSYASGPGGIRLAESYINNGERPNHVNSNYNSKDFIQDATAPLNYEPHGGADVAIYAHGPWAHLYHGTQEQNYIPHVIRYAACYGDSQENACTRATEEPPMCTGSAHPTAHAPCASLILLLAYLIMIMFEI